MLNKRILYVTTIGSTMVFFESLIKELLDEGNIVDIATNELDRPVPECFKIWGCNVYPISTSRSPFSIGNIKAIGQIKKIVKEKHYDIVHCHTPLAAMATRFACRKLRKKQDLKVIYTAHGFHFYKGAPKKNWIIYYPVEKFCARWTDVLITINKEDYELAKKKLHAKRVEYVPGVGIDVDKFANVVVDKAAKRRELDVPEDVFLLLSVGELNENKNHQIIIRAIAKIGDKNIHYAIAGQGDKKEELEALAKDLNVNLHLLGYRTDISELYKVADVFIHPSYREGLPVSVMEARAAGIRVIGSNIRGNADLLPKECLFDPCSIDSVSTTVGLVLSDNRMDNNVEIGLFDIKEINKKMEEIYFD